MTAVAVWPEHPSADALLADRLRRGWRPQTSPMAAGPTVLGHAACLFEGGCGPLVEAMRPELSRVGAP